MALLKTSPNFEIHRLVGGKRSGYKKSQFFQKTASEISRVSGHHFTIRRRCVTIVVPSPRIITADIHRLPGVGGA